MRSWQKIQKDNRRIIYEITDICDPVLQFTGLHGKLVIKSLLAGWRWMLRVLIIDDGSKDSTGDIADAYEKKYPGIIRAIHQVNGGHGEAVNAGIRNATGLYFKVVDSDDWVDEEAYKKILDKLRELTGGNQTLDMFIANYVYEKEGAHHKKVMHYTNLPQNQILPGMMCHVSERVSTF